ncbi:hypothetical protein KAR91_65085 [Candidatus Pacearchaeota archaeon]|nr:hypothetical protein [Candidatus Pacearchaeota archaeon]
MKRKIKTYKTILKELVKEELLKKDPNIKKNQIEVEYNETIIAGKIFVCIVIIASLFGLYLYLG